MEIWKTINNYPDYQISNKGYVKSFKNKTPIILKTSLNQKGYKQLVLRNEQGEKTLRIHRLVAKAFIPNPTNLPQVNHKNGIKTCNEDWNLEWTNNSGNQKHAFANGLQTNVGNNNPNIRGVDQFDLDGNFIKHWNSIYDITNTLGYSRSSIWRCCSGKYKTSHGYIWRYTE